MRISRPNAHSFYLSNIHVYDAPTRAGSSVGISTSGRVCRGHGDSTIRPNDEGRGRVGIPCIRRLERDGGSRHFEPGRPRVDRPCGPPRPARTLSGAYTVGASLNFFSYSAIIDFCSSGDALLILSAAALCSSSPLLIFSMTCVLALFPIS